MRPFEEELKEALKRRSPPEDFTARVLAKTKQDGRTISGARRFRPNFLNFRLLAPLAAMLVLVTVGTVYEHQMSVERGQAAKQQLMAAMRIAGAELHKAELRVKRIHSSEVVLQ